MTNESECEVWVMIWPRQISLLIRKRLGGSLWTPKSNLKESCRQKKTCFWFFRSVWSLFFSSPYHQVSFKIICLNIDHDFLPLLLFSSSFSFSSSSSSFSFLLLVSFLLEASSYSSSFRPLCCKFGNLRMVSDLVTAQYFPSDLLKTTSDDSEDFSCEISCRAKMRGCAILKPH